MPIFIARESDGVVLSVVIARNMDLATSYFQGQGVVPYTTDKLSDKDLESHPTGVIPISKTSLRSVWEQTY